MKKAFIFLLCLIVALTCVSCSSETDDIFNESQSSFSSFSPSDRPIPPSSKNTSSKNSQSSSATANSSSNQSNINSLTESSSLQSGDNSSQSSNQSSQTSSSSSGSSTEIPVEDDFITTTVTNGYVKENNVYTITLAGDYILHGVLTEGQIVVNVGDDDKVNLILNGVTMTNSTDSVIKALNADRLSIKAVKGTINEITDNRSIKTTDNELVGEGAINAKCDLTLTDYGDGEQAILVVTGNYNNGVHCTKDLTIKKLNLTSKAVNNAIKGNNSITISSGTVKAVSTSGDGLKTKDSNVTSKGNQKGTVTIEGGSVSIYASCDGIDSAYNVDVLGGELNIYTNKYSSYTEGVISDTSTVNYIKVTSAYYSTSYRYAFYFYNSDSDYTWVDASYYTSASDRGRPMGNGSSTYYYYKLERPSSYKYFVLYRFNASQTENSTTTYNAKSSSASVNTSMDMFSIKSVSSSLITGDWATYTAPSQSGAGQGGPGGPGGMEEGNTDKLDYSTKGIKASNEINIVSGTVYINSFDDSLHANSDVLLDNGSYGTGNVNISGGTITLLSNDDGAHADGILTASGGSIRVERCYEGLEGLQVLCSGANIYIVSSDDGINATSTTAEGGIIISDGTLYVYAGGDGIDSNSTVSYKGIIISGGKSIIISNGPSDSSIDTERGYTYTGGTVLGIGRSGGMSSESLECSNFSQAGVSTNLNAQQNSYVIVTVDSQIVTLVKMPTTINSLSLYLGSSSASITTSSQISVQTNSDGYYFA